MAKRVRYKPTPSAICRVMTSDDARGVVHISDIGGKAMQSWLTKHKHIEKYGRNTFFLTRKGKKLGDRACSTSFGR